MKKNYGRTNIIVRFAVVLLLVCISFAIVEMQVELRSLRARKAALEEEVAVVNDEITELEYNIKSATEMTDEYIERVAIEKLGYRYKGEIVFYNDMAN